MAVIELYCPCKVKKLGLGLITGDFAPYTLWATREEREAGVRENGGTYDLRCKFCKGPIRYVGDDPKIDKKYKKWF